MRTTSCGTWPRRTAQRSITNALLPACVVREQRPRAGGDGAGGLFPSCQTPRPPPRAAHGPGEPPRRGGERQDYLELAEGTVIQTRGTTELKATLLAFSGDFYKFQILRLVEFYNFLSVDEVCLLLYPGLLLKEGTGLVSFVLIGKAVRLTQSINCITVYPNKFFSAFGAGFLTGPAVFPSLSSIREKDGKFLLCVALLTHSLFYYRNYFRVFV